MAPRSIKPKIRRPVFDKQTASDIRRRLPHLEARNWMPPMRPVISFPTIATNVPKHRKRKTLEEKESELDIPPFWIDDAILPEKFRMTMPPPETQRQFNKSRKRRPKYWVEDGPFMRPLYDSDSD